MSQDEGEVAGKKPRKTWKESGVNTFVRATTNSSKLRRQWGEVSTHIKPIVQALEESDQGYVSGPGSRPQSPKPDVLKRMSWQEHNSEERQEIIEEIASTSTRPKRKLPEVPDKNLKTKKGKRKLPKTPVHEAIQGEVEINPSVDRRSRPQRPEPGMRNRRTWANSPSIKELPDLQKQQQSEARKAEAKRAAERAAAREEARAKRAAAKAAVKEKASAIGSKMRKESRAGQEAAANKRAKELAAKKARVAAAKKARENSKGR